MDARPHFVSGPDWTACVKGDGIKTVELMFSYDSDVGTRPTWMVRVANEETTNLMRGSPLPIRE